jgi:flagellar basal-body rod protein FlgB
MAGFTLFGPTQQLLMAALRLRGARHELLTANIANADTPGYRSRDLDFTTALRSLVQSNVQPADKTGDQGVLASTHPQHLQPSGTTIALIEEEEGEGKLDRNQVDLDREITQLTENALLQETSLTLLSRTLAGLRYAIGEGRG